MTSPVLTITRLGAEGDGHAEGADGQSVFVPFALPGERWELGAEGTPSRRLSDSPERAEPVCRHFGTCGGCVTQHMSDALYGAWKHDIVVQAFAHRGIEAEVLPLRRISPRSRRRAGS